jgi:peptidylprolyl isomerase
MPNVWSNIDSKITTLTLAPYLSYLMNKSWKRWLETSFVALLLVTVFLGLSVAWWTPVSNAALPAGNAITDGKALLRYALPIDNQPVRKLQGSLEDIANQLRANRRWGAISSDITTASRIVSDRDAQILASVPEDRKPQADRFDL